MSQDGNMVTCSSIIVNTPLESSDIVDAGHYHHSLGYEKEYDAFAVIRCHHIPTAVIPVHF